MHEMIVKFGSVILAVLIVVALVLGLMRDQAQKTGEAVNNRYVEIYDSINSNP